MIKANGRMVALILPPAMVVGISLAVSQPAGARTLTSSSAQATTTSQDQSGSVCIGRRRGVQR